MVDGLRLPASTLWKRVRAIHAFKFALVLVIGGKVSRSRWRTAVRLRQHLDHWAGLDPRRSMVVAPGPCRQIRIASDANERRVDAAAIDALLLANRNEAPQAPRCT
jgi:hypothetical protein